MVYARHATVYHALNFLENGVDIWQFIESRGIHVIPHSFLERRVKSMNVRSLVRDNVAFKLSFGLTFAMAAFAEFYNLDFDVFAQYAFGWWKPWAKRCAGFIAWGCSCICSCLQVCQKALTVSLKAAPLLAFLYICQHQIQNSQSWTSLTWSCSR